MKKLLYLPFLCVIVALGCGQSTKHYEMSLTDFHNNEVTPVDTQAEREQIRLQARHHAAADQKKNRKKTHNITYHTPKSYPYGLRFKIPAHRLGTYDIHKDTERACIYHFEYAKETKRLQRFATRPRVIALGLLICCAIIAIIAAETR